MALGQATLRVEVLRCEFSFHQCPILVTVCHQRNSGPIASRSSNRQSHSTTAAAAAATATTTTTMMMIMMIMIIIIIAIT
jgi:hypothetical protein